MGATEVAEDFEDVEDVDVVEVDTICVLGLMLETLPTELVPVLIETALEETVLAGTTAVLFSMYRFNFAGPRRISVYNLTRVINI